MVSDYIYTSMLYYLGPEHLSPQLCFHCYVGSLLVGTLLHHSWISASLLIGSLLMLPLLLTRLSVMATQVYGSTLQAHPSIYAPTAQATLALPSRRH